ncbi:hypothetical protein EDD17DRAFT_1668331, partial [Pisolithus thermaeus]
PQFTVCLTQPPFPTSTASTQSPFLPPAQQPNPLAGCLAMRTVTMKTRASSPPPATPAPPMLAARPSTEQRRRDEPRDGYRRFKHALSVPNQKSSNVSLLGRDTTDVKYLDVAAQQL